MPRLSRVEISGFKSIERMSLELSDVNVLIGANGAGKSNLVLFFRAVKELAGGGLQLFVGTSGGANGLLHYGAKATPRFVGTLQFDASMRYAMYLDFAEPDSLAFVGEDIPKLLGEERPMEYHLVAGGGYRESALEQSASKGNAAAQAILDALRGIHVFHFNDTSRESRVRRSCYLHDNRHLARDGGNLAAVLYRMKMTQATAYDRTVRTIQQILPWFGGFRLEPLTLNPNNIQLDWQERGSDFLFGPHQLPDGALRAMALVTLLLQPTEYLPSVIVIDEPELGLHPHALTILAALVKGAAVQAQVVLATQSVALLEQFEPQDVVVVDREHGASTFSRLDPEKLKDWLEEYSLGELWEKNVIGGGPV